MKRFNVVFLVCNLLLLCVVLFIHFETLAREKQQFELIKPVFMRYYAQWGLQLPFEDPKNMYELLAPMQKLYQGLSK